MLNTMITKTSEKVRFVSRWNYVQMEIRAIPFYIHTPLWKRSIKIYPLRIKDQKCRHVPPHQRLPKFSFPLRKKGIFFQTPRKYLKDQRRRRSEPLRNDVEGPPQKISSIGGGGGGY